MESENLKCKALFVAIATVLDINPIYSLSKHFATYTFTKTRIRVSVDSFILLFFKLNMLIQQK